MDSRLHSSQTSVGIEAHATMHSPSRSQIKEESSFRDCYVGTIVAVWLNSLLSARETARLSFSCHTGSRQTIRVRNSGRRRASFLVCFRRKGHTEDEAVVSAVLTVGFHRVISPKSDKTFAFATLPAELHPSQRELLDYVGKQSRWTSVTASAWIPQA